MALIDLAIYVDELEDPIQFSHLTRDVAFSEDIKQTGTGWDALPDDYNKATRLGDIIRMLDNPSNNLRYLYDDEYPELSSDTWKLAAKLHVTNNGYTLLFLSRNAMSFWPLENANANAVYVIDDNNNLFNNDPLTTWTWEYHGGPFLDGYTESAPTRLIAGFQIDDNSHTVSVGTWKRYRDSSTHMGIGYNRVITHYASIERAAELRIWDGPVNVENAYISMINALIHDNEAHIRPYNKDDEGELVPVFNHATDKVTTPLINQCPIEGTQGLGYYTCTGDLQDIKNFFAWLKDPTWWDDAGFIEWCNKFFGQKAAFGAIGRLYSIPITFNAVPHTANKVQVPVGNTHDDGTHLYGLASSSVELDLGTIEVPENKPDGFLNYAPYCTVELYLPYIGVVSLDPSIVMGAKLTVKYKISLITGNFLAEVDVKKDPIVENGVTLAAGIDDSVMYRYSGNMLIQMQFTSETTDIPALMSTFVSTVFGTLGAAVSSGGAGTYGVLANSAGSVAESTLHHEKSGAVNASSANFDVKYPYLIVTRKIKRLPENWHEYNGMSTNVYYKLKDVSGYTQCDMIHLEGIPYATPSELNQLEQYFKEGVIL